MKILSSFSVIVLVFLTQSMLLAQNVSPQFSELNGIEDEQGNTHLFYRIHSYQELDPFGFFEDNSVYHLNRSNQIDTLFLNESGSNMMGYFFQNDFKIINFSPMHYINVGTSCPMECSPFAYNSNYGFIFENGSWGSSYKIAFGQNPDLIYYGLDAWDMDSSITTLRSNDGGLNWDTLSSRKIFMSLNPYNNKSSFYLDILTQGVFKSSDSGVTFQIVDTTQTFINPDSPEFYYDPDQTHIYRKSIKGGQQFQYYLSVSDNNGEPFSWSNKYSSNNPISFSNDTSQTGAVYLADGKKIFFSSNYGSTFSLYKELNSKIVGIYKKPNSDKLYAATKHNIYEITNDSITIIKSLPIPEELLAYYPLSVGDYWIYKVSDWSYPYYSEDTFTKKVISKETLSNNKEYFKIEEKYHGSSYSYFVYERVDSVNGLVYRFDNECTNPDSEKVIDNFTAEVGDSLLIQRYTMCWDSILTLFATEGSENIFNENRSYRSFEYNWLMGYTHKLVSGIGIHSVRSGYDFGETNYTLNGCVINDIVYGDTTLTDVGNENNLTPTEFNLEPNYPNPFNPNTTISFQLRATRNVSLKVFDILGNEIETLINEEMPAGSYEVNFDASKLSSGIYFYTLYAGDFIKTRKMILMK